MNDENIPQVGDRVVFHRPDMDDRHGVIISESRSFQWTGDCLFEDIKYKVQMDAGYILYDITPYDFELERQYVERLFPIPEDKEYVERVAELFSECN